MYIHIHMLLTWGLAPVTCPRSWKATDVPEMPRLLSATSSSTASWGCIWWPLYCNSTLALLWPATCDVQCTYEIYTYWYMDVCIQAWLWHYAVKNISIRNSMTISMIWHYSYDITIKCRGMVLEKRIKQYDIKWGLLYNMNAVQNTYLAQSFNSSIM